MKLFTNFTVTYIPEIEKQDHYFEGIYIKSWRETGEVKEKTVLFFLVHFSFSLSKHTHKYIHMSNFEGWKIEIVYFGPEEHGCKKKTKTKKTN